MNTERRFQGYCVGCHEMREIDSGTFCPVCASPLMDLHEMRDEEAPIGAVNSPAAPAAHFPSGFAPPAPPAGPGSGWSTAPTAVPSPTTIRAIPTLPGEAHTRGRGPGVLIAVLVAVAALIGAAAIVFLLTRDGDADETVSPTVPTATAPVASAPGADTPAVVPPATGPSEGGSITTPLITAPAATMPPASGGSGGVTIVDWTAYAEESSLTIDGESRTLYTVAELRNDGADTVEVGEVTVTIRDSAGIQIAVRQDYPIDRVLAPGETTYLYEFTPSMTYWETETNDFPEGWASFDLSFEVESPYVPSEWDDVNLAVENVVVSPSGGDVVANGLIRNTSPVAVSSSAEVYLALYGADGRLVNVAWTYVSPGDVEVLQPGDTIAFEVPAWNGPQQYSSYVVGAVSSPAS